MHCIGELIERDRLVAGLEMLRQDALPRPRHRRHHAVGADRDHAVDVAERNRLRAELPRAVGVDRRDDVADEGAVLRPRRA